MNKDDAGFTLISHKNAPFSDLDFSQSPCDGSVGVLRGESACEGKLIFLKRKINTHGRINCSVQDHEITCGFLVRWTTNNYEQSRCSKLCYHAATSSDRTRSGPESSTELPEG